MKLPDIGEEVILRLDAEDEAGIWRSRDVYQRRISALQESHLEVLAIKAMKHFGVSEPESRLTPRKHGWGGARRKAGQGVDQLERGLDLVVDDARRIKDMLRSHGRKQQRRDDKVTAELIAAERHLRIVHGKIGEGEEWAAELRELVEKLHKRIKSSGTTGAERNKRAKMRAK